MSVEIPYVRELGRCEICGRPSDELERVVTSPARKTKPPRLERVVYVCDRHPTVEPAPVKSDVVSRASRRLTRLHPQEERLFG